MTGEGGFAVDLQTRGAGLADDGSAGRLRLWVEEGDALAAVPGGGGAAAGGAVAAAEAAIVRGELSFIAIAALFRRFDGEHAHRTGRAGRTAPLERKRRSAE